MDNLAQNIGIIIGLACVLPMITLGIMAAVIFWFGKRQFDRFVAPSTESLFEQYQEMVTQNPNQDHDAHIKKIVGQQAFKCGVVGAITGVGGFFTLPITLPIDVLLSVQIQAAMVQFIASAYGHSEDRDSKIATYMIMTGSGEVTQMSSRVLMNYVIKKLVGKSFAKMIPLVGAVIGFIVNYWLARSTGWVAMRWYEQKNAGTEPMIPAGEAV
ncbi:MAG: hypothetical protein KC708_17590 [Anaerolineae bacterium]|nr:hypothetical protein [Anaerolineae bacterium]